MNNLLTMKYPSSWHGDVWREGAPCGSGEVGALVYGGVGREIIALNHARLWRGGKLGKLPDVSDSIAEVRRLLDEKRPDLADGVIAGALRSHGYEAGGTMPLPLGDILIQNHSQKPFYDYSRTVDMSSARVDVSWREGTLGSDDAAGARFTRSTFVSRSDGIVYTLITSDMKGAVHIGVTLGVHDTETMRGNIIKNAQSSASDGYVFYAAENESAYECARGDYGGVLRAVNIGGSAAVNGSGIDITGADSVLIAVKTFVGGELSAEFERIKAELAADIDFDAALEAHIALHRKYYGGVDFSISQTDRSNEELLLDAFGSGASDELIEKMYAYGRYLFVCSTGGCGALPTHLTGLWNGTYECFWAIYMYNVNFEMIYWQALSGNQPQLARTALDYTESFTEDFKNNARSIFGCRGIYIDSVNTPESGLAVCLANHIINWTSGAAWISQHFYDYYRYTLDIGYLRRHALPFMYQAALFYEDFLRVGEDGKYEFAPSTSPENIPSSTSRRFSADAQTAKNAAMDIAAVRELLTNLIEGSAIADMYSDKIDTWSEMLSLLPDYKTNADGSLKEWADDFYEDQNAHRHHSHMYGVFPGHSVRRGTALYDAFVRAEDKRIAQGLNSQSSWSMIYMSCINARMGRGDIALGALSEMARTCCMNNLFTVHNDWRRMGEVGCDDFRIAPFQIDANIGFTAAINEMLMSSAGEDIVLFPALPSKWESGRIEGLRAAGGFIVSLYWTKEAARVNITRSAPGKISLRTGSSMRFENGETSLAVSLDRTLDITLRR